MTIRRRILLAYLAMLAISLGLIVGVDEVLHSYHRGDALRILRGLQPHTAFSRMARYMSVTNRLINLQILEDPDGLTSQELLQRLEPPLPDLGIVVRRGLAVAYTSPALRSSALPALPAFAARPRLEPERAGSEPPREPPAEPPPERQVVGQWDFRFSDGTPGSLFFVRRFIGAPPRVPDLNVLLVIAAVLLLAGGNGLITFAVARSMSGPLRTLERAVERIGRGDLDQPMEIPRTGDELARVCEAFERMRQTLRDSLAKQRQYEQGRLELIASISHDLRTPVTTIKGYAEGLRDGVAASPERRERYLRTIVDRAETMDHLIEELFLLSTLELEQAPFAFRTLDLREFLTDSVEDLQRVHERAVIALQAPEAAVWVSADPSQLRRAIENVVENSVRHSGLETPRIDVRLEAVGGSAVVRIGDNGRGIPVEALPFVFERFYRADSSRSTRGSGLGLAIARRIVEAHRGEIRAASSGEGALITIALPLEEPAPAAAVPAASGGSAGR